MAAMGALLTIIFVGIVVPTIIGFGWQTFSLTSQGAPGTWSTAL